jgi:hypothetical protein
LVLALGACKKNQTPSEAPAAPQALVADAPQGFGPRCVWMAFRGQAPDEVARVMAIRDFAPATWANGLKAAYAGQVFVTPPIADTGWVLAASTRLPDPGDKHHPDAATPVLQILSRTLGEVQYFATYDVLDLHAWARFMNGVAVRKLAFIGADGVVVWDEGELSPEERRLGLNYTRKTLAHAPFPSEANVFALAGAWSVDPTTLQTRHLPPSLGLVGSLP